MVFLALLAPLSLLTQQPAIDTKVAARYLQEAKWIAAEDGGKLWGKSLDGPLLFVHAPTRTAVANEEAEGMGMTAYDGVWVGKLPNELIIANTAFDWKGKKWSMVMWPVNPNRVERARLLIHELWHRIQDDVGLPAETPRNVHLDTLQGRLWLLMEVGALRRAMLAETKDRQAFVEDALLFRAYRQSLFPGSKREEDRMEVHEGLAEYTGLMLRGTWEPETRYGLAYRMLSFNMKRSFPASFAYETGPAYGLLLNVIEAIKFDAITWRTKVSPKSSLSDMVAEYVDFKTPADLKEAAIRQAAAYGYSDLLKIETERETKRAALEASYKKILVDGPVLELPWVEANFSYDPGNVFPLGSQGTVYPTTTISAAWGKMVTGAALVAPDWSRAFVSAPTDAANPLKGNGWTLELKPGWKVVAGKRKGDFVIVKS